MIDESSRILSERNVVVNQLHIYCHPLNLEARFEG